MQVTARGSGVITSVYIDPDAIAQHTADELGPIVARAVNDALRLVKEASAAKFKPIIDAASQPGRTF